MKLPDPRATLRVRGSLPARDLPHVAIVGSRRPTPYGEAVALRLARELAAAGAVVVSGLARGVDAAAHIGAIEGDGQTIAVLGSGIDVVYPASNASLAARIASGHGAVVSEFPDGTPPARSNFPRRNWTIAALSEVVVVVEAAQGSGSLITAEAALSLGREVMAVPGSVFSAQSVGCHQLLRDGAGVVQNSRDVLRELGRELEVLDDTMGGADDGRVEGRHDGLLRHLSDAMPLAADDVARKLALPFAEVLSRLTRLELEGCVTRAGDGYLKVTQRR